MQLKEFDILLDIKKHNKIEYIELVQGDHDTNILNISLVDGTEEYNLSGLNVEIAFSKSDGTTVLQDVENGVALIGNKIVCTLKTNTISSPGRILAEVRVLEGLKVLTSSRFDFYSRKAIANDDTIKSTSEFPILEKLTNDVTGIIASEDSRVSNEDIRLVNETDRVSTEEIRRTKEQGRIDREAMRNQNEDDRETSEAERIQFESNRKVAEETRIDKESMRITSEDTRVAAEDIRKRSETDRVTAEDARVIAEDDRATTFAGYESRVTGVEDDLVAHKEDYATSLNVSPNLFDKNNVTNNAKLDIANGEEIPLTNWVTSKFIPVKKMQNYKRSHNSILCFYSDSYTFINGFGGNTIAVNSGNGTYAKITTDVLLIDVLQLEKGDITTTYRTYKDIKIDKLNLRENEEINRIKKGMINTKHDTMPFKPKTPKQIIDIVKSIDIPTIAGGKYVQDEYVRWGERPFGLRVTTTGLSNSSLYFTNITPISATGINAIGMWIYIEDVASVNAVQLHLSVDDENYGWYRGTNNLSYPLKNGWNLLRWQADTGVIGEWGEIRQLRVLVITNSATEWVLGTVFGEKSEKAQIMFVQDGGYTAFYEKGYPQLIERGIPITWALTPGRLGIREDLISESIVDELAENHLNAFSFHSWDSTPSSTMSVDEFRNDTIKCIRWLQKKGLQPRHWHRAAITQNAASQDQVNAINDLVECYSTYKSESGSCPFPFINPRGFPRQMLEVVSQETIGKRFDLLKKTHALNVVYTHGIGTGATFDVSQANWDYFISRIDQGINEGWLEGVTYDILIARHEEQFGGYGYETLVNATKFNS